MVILPLVFQISIRFEMILAKCKLCGGNVLCGYRLKGAFTFHDLTIYFDISLVTDRATITNINIARKLKMFYISNAEFLLNYLIFVFLQIYWDLIINVIYRREEANDHKGQLAGSDCPCPRMPGIPEWLLERCLP